MPDDCVRVTDHAVLRYMERVQGVDVEAVRRHILATCRGAVLSGAVSLSAEGVRFEFSKAHAVVTVSPGGQMPSRTTCQRVTGRAG